MHVIDQENYQAAGEAIRDILLMYADVAQDRCFVHGAEYPIRFDPLVFVDVVQDAAVYYFDIDLLRTGSALAIVATFHSGWAEERGVHAGPDTDRFRQAVAAGRLRHLPDIEAVMFEFLTGRHAASDDPWFDDVTNTLCERHVLGYFRRLVDREEQSHRGPEDWMTLG